MAAATVAVGVAVAPGSAQAVIVPPSTNGTIVSANPADHTPHARSGEARAFAQIGNTVYVGGTFQEIKANGAATWTSRPYLFAYDRATGVISTTFLPVLDGAVNALAVSPDNKLIVGGAFVNVNGVSRKNLVELDPTTGATIAAWVGRSDGGNVRSMAVNGNHLYIGGAFHWVNGTAHSLVARLNATTGAIDSTFQIDASVPRAGTELVWTLGVSPDGAHLAIGGNFTTVNGLARNQIALIELTGTPAVANWSTERYVHPCYNWAFAYYVQDIDFSDDSSYFVVGANGGRGDGAYCDAIARFESTTRGSGIDGTWVDYTGTDTVTAVEAADGIIYTGGHFRWLNNPNGNDAPGHGAVDRLGVGALDPSNGMPLNWNPRRSPGGALPPGGSSWGSTVPVLWRGTDGVYFGQNSDGMGNEYHGRLGLFPLAGGRTVVAPANQAAPGYVYLSTASGQLAKIPYGAGTLGTTASTLAAPSYVGAGATFAVGDKIYWSRTDAGIPGGSELAFSMFNGTTVGAPWNSGYNTWFTTANMTGAFYVNGRMYYTLSGQNSLYYRYVETDGYYVGGTQFTLPTTNINWFDVRGLAYVNGQLMYGATDGHLRIVGFDPTAASGYAVDGSLNSLVAASGTAGLSFSSTTLFYADR